MSEGVKKGDLVCSRCTSPAVGYVVRVGSYWADVEWFASVGNIFRTRAKKCDIVKIIEYLNAIVKASNGDNITD